MTKRARRTSKARRTVRPPVIDLKAEETPAKEETVAGAGAAKMQAKHTTGGADTPKEKPATPADKTAPGGKAKQDGKAKPDGQPPGRLSKLITAGLVLLVIAVAGLGVWLYRNTSAATPDTRQIAALSDIDQRLQAIETAGKTNAQTLAGLTEALTGAQSKIAGLTQALAGAEGKVAGLEADLMAQRDAAKQNLTAVGQEIEELRSILAAAASSGNGSGAGQAANKMLLDELTEKLSSLAGRMEQAETAIAAPAPQLDTGAIAALESKLGTLEQTLGALGEQQAKQAVRTASDLGQAFAKLSGRLATSAPFADELDALATLTPAAPGIGNLRPLAATGVVANTELALQLDKIASTASEAQSAAAVEKPAGGGVMDTLMARLSTVVKIRKIDDVDWPAALADASTRIRNGQLARALTLIDGKPGDAPDGLTDWLASARNRLKADEALQQLSQAVLKQLAQTGGSG